MDLTSRLLFAFTAVQGDITTVTGQQAFTTVGTYSWVCPVNVFDVQVVCIGGGGRGGVAIGGAGGGLGWKNLIPVVPGSSYTVVVGAGGSNVNSGFGGNSYFISPSTVQGGGGEFFQYPSTEVNYTGGTYTGDGGGNGGSGIFVNQGNNNLYGGGGGGGGGYTGNGGASSTSGSGGGGGGGGTGYASNTPGEARSGAGGGGTGLLGQSGSGYAGTNSGSFSSGSGGGGGSGGQAGHNSVPNDVSQLIIGGAYGGGGAGLNTGGYDIFYPNTSAGAQGAVRIIWGQNRSFPSTNTGNL